MSLEEPLAAPVEAAAALMRAAKHVVALVGAGLSVESGVPPFRGPGGLWTKYGEPDMDGYRRFLADPKGWWEEAFQQRSDLAELHQALEEAKPNAGHYALAEMERLGFLHHIITQNIDNLHQEAGSQAVTEIHGNRYKLRCLRCTSRFPLEGGPFQELPPGCPHCGGLVKSDVVMFGGAHPWGRHGPVPVADAPVRLYVAGGDVGGGLSGGGLPAGREEGRRPSRRGESPGDTPLAPV